MGLFKRTITTTEVGAALADSIIDWCAPKELQDHKEFLQVPATASNFEKETVYLYLFLVTYACEIAYSEDDTVCHEILDAFHRRIYALLEIRESDLAAFESTLHDRYRAYWRLADKGALPRNVV